MTGLTSQNGYGANDRSVIASYSLPGGKVALRAGDVSVVLLWCANQWHQTVEPLVWPGIWGYAERTIRGSSTTLSNHASGTAIDLNAPKHPLGVAASRNFTPAQIAQVHRIVDACDGVVRWGGDYDSVARGGVAGSRADPMHLEVVAGAAAVRAVADKIRGGQPSTSSASPATTPRAEPGDDAVYVISQLTPSGPPAYALLTGPMFVGLGSPGEVADAKRAISAGAPYQWVERFTWNELDKRSHALCDNPRPVAVADTSTGGAAAS